MKQRKFNPYPDLDIDIDDPLSDHADDLAVFLDKPFWIWDQKEHDIKFKETEGKCCHVDILGRPQKDGVDYPLFDYQKLIYDAIENNMNIWILKSRGIGLTTFLIYYLTWKILHNNDLDHANIFIISGTRETHANYIKEKMAGLFERNFPLLNLYTKYTEMVLKNTWIKVFPSLQIKDLRGYFSAAYIWVDESDFMNESVQQELVSAIQPYQIKSNCKIILSSTPNKPNGIMQTIELDKNSKYYKLRLPYQLGVNKIYSVKDIEEQKNNFEWKREMELQYLGHVGNVFSPYAVDKCIKLGEQYKNLEINHSVSHALGVDVGASDSKTALCLVEHLQEFDKVRVVYSEELEIHPSYSDIVKKVFQIYKNTGNCWVYIDGSARSLITELKIAFDENIHYKRAEDVTLHNNRIIPVNFVSEHKQLLQNLYSLVSSEEYLCIPASMDKIIISLKSAVAKEYSLDKTQSSYNDTLDALRLACRPFHFK